MPVSISDVNTLKLYIEGVMGRAQHHANNVSAVTLALAGAIIWRKDGDPIQVMQQSGDMKNVLWATISGQRYAFSYNHVTQEIEMRRDNTRGSVLHRFSNSTSSADIEAIFRRL